MNLLPYLLCILISEAYSKVANASSEWFRPKVICICVAKGFDITLETTQPFFGTIHPVNRTGCHINGIGKNRTNYLIPFSSANFCNVRYDVSTNTYTVKLEVNEHQVLVLQRDRTFEFSCEQQPHSSDVEQSASKLTFKRNKLLKPTIGVYNDQTKVTDAVYGNPYNLRVTFNDNFTIDNYRIVNCFAANGLNTSVQIIDGTGCSTNCNLIEEFNYSQNVMAEAAISSMFKFPKTNKLQITCNVVRRVLISECQSRCADQTNLILDNGYNNESNLLDDIMQIRKTELPSERDEQRISCIVTINTADRILSSVASDALEPEVTCAPNAEFSFLRNLCIVLCAAFLAGCSINIVFCCLYLIKRKPECKCGKKSLKNRKKLEEPQSNCDFWIKEKTLPKNIGDGFDGDAWNQKTLQRPVSTKSYATIRQKIPHYHPNLSQIPLKISQNMAESPSLNSTDSSQTSTFGVRQILPTSYTIDTDLNSLHSSVSTEKTGGYFIKNGDFSTSFSVDGNCLTNISNNSKEAYSIL